MKEMANPRKGSNVYFTKRLGLHGVINKINKKIANVTWEDDDGMLIKKGRKKSFDVSLSEITLVNPKAKRDFKRRVKIITDGK